MVEYSILEPWQAVDENGLVFDQGSLIAVFYDLLDPRHARGKRYSLATLLTLVFLAKLSGMDSPSAIADWCQAHRRNWSNCCICSTQGCPDIERSGACLPI